MKIRLLAILIPAFLFAVAFMPAVGSAADHTNLEEGLPTELTDAMPTKYRNTEIQGLARWGRTEKGEEKFLIEPRLEYGLWLNTQLSIVAPYEFGQAVEEDEFKTIGVELFYNFNQEGFYIPAVALAGKADFPVGDEPEGIDTTAKLILSKTVGRTANWHRVHFNVDWMHNDDAADDERRNHYKFILGYDRLLNADTILVLDLVREQEREEKVDINLVEAGIRYQITPLTVIAGGVGVGVGEDSPDFRVTLAFQHSLNAWYLGGK
jgi:hypothetical protein